MDYQLSNALSTMSLRHLFMFLHFETYAFANPQKAGFCRKSGVELDFLLHIYEERSQVGIPERYSIPDFVDFGTHMFQIVEKYLGVVEPWLIVRLKTDDSYF